MFELKTVYLAIPYEMLAEANKYRCLFLPEPKIWTIRCTDDDNDDKITFMKNYAQVYLKVPYDEKDAVKANGGRWDPHAKRWYTYIANSELKKYMDL